MPQQIPGAQSHGKWTDRQKMQHNYGLTCQMPRCHRCLHPQTEHTCLLSPEQTSLIPDPKGGFGTSQTVSGTQVVL